MAHTAAPAPPPPGTLTLIQAPGTPGATIKIPGEPNVHGPSLLTTFWEREYGVTRELTLGFDPRIGFKQQLRDLAALRRFYRRTLGGRLRITSVTFQ